MKKFYGSVAIISVIIIHSAFRFVMADDYTFTASEYINTESNQESVSFENYTPQVSTTFSNIANSDYKTSALSHVRFIITSNREHNVFNH